MTAILATFADFKLVKSRAVAQLVFEVPVEQADAALTALGGLPRADIERWAGIAPLDTTAVAARPADGGVPQASGNGGDKPRRFHSMTRAQQAGIRCNDPAFRSWLANRDPAMWKTAVADEPPDASQDVITARLVRALCGVKSRTELDTDPTAGRAWDALNDEFEAATGRRAERMW